MAASPKSFGVWLLGIALLAAVIAIVVVLPPKRTGDAVAVPPAPPSVVPAQLIRDEAQTFAQYAGSAACAECHKDEHTHWKTSNHGLAERAPSAELDRRAFDPPRSFQHGTQHTDIGMRETRYQITALGLEKKYEPMTVAGVIGHDPLRQFLVNFPGGRVQTLEAAYDPHRGEWFNVYGNEDRQPGEWGHWTGRGMNWNTMCAGCHNTRLRKNYVEQTDSYATTMAEPSIGCEACHGPLKKHVQWRQANPRAQTADPAVPKFTPDQIFETCGQCHARRMEFGGDFAPGDSFYEHFALSVVDDSDLYYADGQVRDEDYEFAAFLGSRMHKAGVRCVNCHDPHTAKVRLPGNAMCMSCHAGNFPNSPVIDPAKHTFHKLDPEYASTDLMALSKRAPEAVVKSGGECVNCHMPQTTYMQRHRRHDHGFTTPDPALTQRLGIPNACNRCHADKDAAWAVEWTDKWYGEKMNRPSRQRAATIAAARQGDPAARAGLLYLLRSNEAPYWLAAAARLLERWAAEPEVNPALLAAAQHPSPLVRTSAVQSLTPLAGNNPDTDAALRKALDDPARSVRFHAAWAQRASVEPQSPNGRELAQILDYLADQPAGQMQKGAYLAARNEPQRALEHYQKAVAWDANSAALRHDYAVLLSSLNRPAEAVAQLEAACKLEPREVEYRYKLALAFNELNDLPKAIAALRETVRLDPRHAHAWYNLGLALNATNAKDDALRALANAEAADPNDPRNPYARATILAQLGRREEAREAAAAALSIQPDYAPARELLISLSR